MVQLSLAIGALLTLISSVVVAKLFVWPRLRVMESHRALLFLVVPHMFLRFIGISFLVPGVVSRSLPGAFAAPAAYGDVVAGILAIVVAVLLARRVSWARPAVWLFNVWGACDLMFAFVQGARLLKDPGNLGAAFFIPTTIVPPMLVSHFLIFGLLARRD